MKPEVEPTVFGLSRVRTSPPRRVSAGMSSSWRICGSPVGSDGDMTLPRLSSRGDRAWESIPRRLVASIRGRLCLPCPGGREIRRIWLEVGPMTSIDVIASTLGDAQPQLGEMSSPDGALTLLFCDIEDAAAIGKELGAERFEELLADHRLIVERVIAHHGGTVVK